MFFPNFDALLELWKLFLTMSELLSFIWLLPFLQGLATADKLTYLAQILMLDDLPDAARALWPLHCRAPSSLTCLRVTALLLQCD